MALLNRSDPRHNDVKVAYAQQQSVLLPQTVLAEVAYLLGRDGGGATVVAFLWGLSASRFSLVALIYRNVMRVAEILEQYADSRIDFVDASVIAIAEHYGIRKILTLDQRDFRLFRPLHCINFELLP